MTYIIILGAVVIVLFAVVASLASVGTDERKEKAQYRYFRRRYLMTRAEHECYDTLVRGLGDKYYIFAQVHLPEIVSEKVGGQKWRAARAHIDRKSVDFVLCDKGDISPVLAIELDDWSHNREDRQERDREVERILEEAGMPLLRITDLEDLAARVLRKLETA